MAHSLSLLGRKSCTRVPFASHGCHEKVTADIHSESLVCLSVPVRGTFVVGLFIYRASKIESSLQAMIEGLHESVELTKRNGEQISGRHLMLHSITTR